MLAIRLGALAAIAGCTQSQPAVTISGPFQTVVLAAELPDRAGALAAEVEAGLSRYADDRRIALLRPLSGAEKDELRPFIPADAPIAVEHLVAIDVRFRRPDGSDGFGRFIIPEHFSARALRGRSSLGPGYRRILERDRARRPIARELADYLVANYRAEEPYPLDSVIPLHYFVELAEQRGIDADELSMRRNNSYAFAARRVRGSARWSQHAVGAIDINPFYNPMITRTGAGRRRGVAMNALTVAALASGQIRVDPLGAEIHAFDRRRLVDRRVIVDARASIVRYFVSRGWSWGGSWRTIKDYHHFSPGRG